MAPSLIGDIYAKDLSQLPSFPGGCFVSREHCFLLPDDEIILRLTETTYNNADYDHIAEIEEIAFTSPDFIVQHIDELRQQGHDDATIVGMIMALEMEDETASREVIARFAYDDFAFVDLNGHSAQGKQIRGAFVTPSRAGVGLAGQVYRQLTIMHKHLACDNSQTVYGAALWASTIRNVAGRVDIYNVAKHQYVEELSGGARGVNGCIPWDIGRLSPLHLGIWQQYPFIANIHQCYYLVLIISA